MKAKIRFDYKAEPGTDRKFFWQHHDIREQAKEIRAKNVALLQNLPFQGLMVEALNLERDVYVALDDQNQEVAYAPVEMVVQADSIADLMPLTLREEFRKIKVMEPDAMSLTSNDVERFLFRVNEEFRSEID
ncbi:MAG TPA: hypothetical protein DDW50_16380 [Firmicutes bacterium]|nr:hypothetical protein [Bacillota bacterium]